jgi:hypothetical protein
LLHHYQSISVGMQGRKLSISDTYCFLELVTLFGDCSPIVPGHHVAQESNDCAVPQEMLNDEGALRSELVANALALQANIWYNQHFNQRDLAVQDLRHLPACVVEYDVIKALGVKATWQDLLDLVNEYLALSAAYPYPSGFAEKLNAALSSLNNMHQGCIEVVPCMDKPLVRSANATFTGSPARIQPNPATDAALIVLDATQTGVLDIEISRTSGQVSTRRVAVMPGTNHIDLNLETLLPGLYFVRLDLAGEVQVIRLVVVP